MKHIGSNRMWGMMWNSVRQGFIYLFSIFPLLILSLDAIFITAFDITQPTQ